MIIADTDVLIDFLHGRGPQVEQVEFELRNAFLGTTAITAFELEAGALTPRHQAAIDDLLGAVAVLPLSRDAARRAGEIHRKLKAAGHGLPMADCLIAAICLTENATLLTRNRKRFERVDGLRLSVGAT